MSNGPIQYVGVGLQLAVTVLLGFFVGYVLDRKFGLLPWCSLGGVLLGGILGFYQLLVQLNIKDNDSK